VSGIGGTVWDEPGRWEELLDPATCPICVQDEPFWDDLLFAAERVARLVRIEYVDNVPLDELRKALA
jgi:hypothetical protein